ncbi:MAG: DNA repair protein RadC [Balneolaceae bacterium]
MNVSRIFVMTPIQQLSKDELPREKLIRFGSGTLSNAELLAILIRTGSAEMNVLETSRHVVQRYPTLRKLTRCDWRELTLIPGIARVKAVTLEAAFELSRRLETATIGTSVTIRSPEDAAAYFSPRLRDLSHEVFMVAFLNNAKRLTGHETVSQGGATATIVDPSDVFRRAILHRARSILVLHNHPSGQARESAADVQLTRRLHESGRLLGIPLDDHIIIAGDHFVSLRSRGLF